MSQPKTQEPSYAQAHAASETYKDLDKKYGTYKDLDKNQPKARA